MAKSLRLTVPNGLLTCGNNEFLFNHIATSKTRKYNGYIRGSFHGETGKSDWSSGHGMLNGSNSKVGDLQYYGYAHVNNDGSVSYLINSPVVLNDPMGDLPVSQEMLSAQMGYYNQMAQMAANYWNSWQDTFRDLESWGFYSRGGGGNAHKTKEEIAEERELLRRARQGDPDALAEYVEWIERDSS